jgi:hypothetical protein
MATAWSSIPTFSAGNALTAAQMTTIATDLSLAGNRPQAFAYQTTTQSVGYGSTATMSFQAETVDTDGIHSTGALSYRLTCVTAGYYLMTGNICYSADATGVRAAYIEKFTTSSSTTAPVVGSLTYVMSNSGTYPTSVTTPTVVVSMAVGDYIQLTGFHTAGAGLNTYYNASTGAASSLFMQWVAPA